MPKLKWDKESIESAVHKFEKENGRFPSTKELDSNENLPSRSIFPKHFDMSYSGWRQSKGDNYSFIDARFKEMSDLELKDWLKNRLIEMGTTHLYEYDSLKKQHEPSSLFWKYRYNWNALMKEIGVREETHYSKDKTVDRFTNIYESLEGTPGSEFIYKEDKKLLGSILFHFGKYNDFLKKLNIAPNKYYGEINKTDDELLIDYLTLCDSLGKLATLREINECEWATSSETYLTRFNSIENVRELLGLDPGKPGKRYYSKQLLINRAKRILNEHGKDVSVKEFLQKINCSKATLAKYFGTASVGKIIKEAEKMEGNRNE